MCDPSEPVLLGTCHSGALGMMTRLPGGGCKLRCQPVRTLLQTHFIRFVGPAMAFLCGGLLTFVTYSALLDGWCTLPQLEGDAQSVVYQ